jgi:hypothetical protein
MLAMRFSGMCSNYRRNFSNCAQYDLSLAGGAVDATRT